MNTEKMSKKELIETIENQSQMILDLQVKLETSNKNSNNRKSQVLELLRQHESLSITELADLLNISTKNVSSQLTYLRTDGYKIFTNQFGRKVLFEDKPEETETETETETEIE